MHLQTGVDRMEIPIAAAPDWFLVKAVSDPSLLLVALNAWQSAGKDPAMLHLDFRYKDFVYPDWEGAARTWTFEQFKDFWRMNFAKCIDGTYYEKYAPYVRYIEELNEYTDSRMVTDAALLAPRIRSAQAAVAVWNGEYRGRNGIPADARLVVCNSPVGNDIPIEYFRLCRDGDAVLGARAYTHWVNKVRDPEDFRWHSGRVFYNEQQYGIKVKILLGEAGPYDGSTDGGWRASSCLGGDETLLVEAMRQWFADLMTTAAYEESRLIGPGAWFTSSNTGGWEYYRLYEPQLSPIVAVLNDLGWTKKEEEIPMPNRAEGIDVSNARGTIQWPKAAAKAEFAIIKASEGPNWQDIRYQFNVDEAQAQGMLVGPYHYWLASAPADTQLAHYLSVTRGNQHEIVHALDFEDWPPADRYVAFGDGVLEVGRQLFAKFGRKTLLYTNLDFYSKIFARIAAQLAEVFDLWLAQWPSDQIPDNPIVPSSWPTPWTIWQYAVKDDGLEYGMDSAPLDHNVFNGTIEEMRARYVAPPPPDRGTPPTEYEKTVWLLYPKMTARLMMAVFLKAMPLNRTVAWNVDDAAMGNLDVRKVVGWNFPDTEQKPLRDYIAAAYPGVEVTFERIAI